jgi:hypothetical protein
MFSICTAGIRGLFPWATAAAVALAAAAAAGCLGCGAGASMHVAGADEFSAVHLVEIVYDKETFIIKGFFEGSPDRFVIKAQNETGVGLFSVSWDGKVLEIEPAGKMVAGMVPFEIRNVAVDIWRIIALWSKDDIKNYNRCNDPDIPEDGVVTAREKASVIVKRIMKGKGTFAAARYYSDIEDPGNPFATAKTIRYVNELIGYEITILQTVPR